MFAASPVAAQAPAEPSLPPIVFQTQPPGQFLDGVRNAADIMFGDKGVKAVNRALKEVFGEKGLEGLDLNRPVVGYVILAPKPQDITAVVALPVDGEKEFLALCDRINAYKHTVDAKDKTLYHLPPLDRRYKAMLRFSEGYAYIAYGFNPAPHIEAKALIPMPKLYDPTERGLVAGRLYFDRIPLAVKLASPVLFEEVKNTLFGGTEFLHPRNEWLAKAVMPEVEKLLQRYVLLAAGADVLTARLMIDPQEGNFVAEAVLTPKPNSELGKLVAAYKTAPNRFASMTNHPDNALAFASRAPLFAPELRAAVAGGLEASRKRAVDSAGEVEKAWTDEAFKGFMRVVKGQELDLGAAFRGPDKDGWFTAVGGIAFDDPAALEKEAKAAFKKSAPQAMQDRMKWDADKAGNVNIHTFHFPTGGFVDFTRFLGGEGCYAAFAFAPQGLIGAVGPDPVPVIKGLLAEKPAAAPAMGLTANPGRIVKMFEKAEGPGERRVTEVANLIGREDKQMPAMSLTVEGGKELTARAVVNLRMLPRLIFGDSLAQVDDEPPAKPAPVPIEKK
jgi:hypothetical protein